MGGPRRKPDSQSEDNLVELGKWPDGVMNAVPGKSIPHTGLMDAINVDIDRKGSIRRRKGFSRKINAVNNTHSLFSDPSGMYFVDGNHLKKTEIIGGFFSTSTIRSDMTWNAPVSWLKEQGQTWYSNGIQNGKLVNGQPFPFSVENPSGQPALSSDTLGNMPGGRYSVSVAFVNQFGEESGNQPRVFIDVPVDKVNGVEVENKRVKLSFIPQPASADINFIRVYVTEPNGTELFRLADLPIGTSTFYVVKSRTKGMALVSELTDQFPKFCVNLDYCRGRLLGSSGNKLWYSEAMRFGLCNLQSNFIIFENDIEFIAAVDDGFYVGVKDSCTYWIEVARKVQGVGYEPAQWHKSTALPYSEFVSGTLIRHPLKIERMWFTGKGQIVASNGGEIKNVTLERIAPNKFSGGAALYRRQDGVEQVVNTFAGGETELMTAYDFADAVIIRKQTS